MLALGAASASALLVGVVGVPGIVFASGPPTVTGVSPNVGPTTGGTSVSVTGTGFTGATAVRFGRVRATNFTVNSDTSITATAPAELTTISAVQNSSTDATSGTTETVTLGSSVTAGDGLVLLFGNQTDLVTVSSVSGGGVTWTKADQENDTTIKGDVEIWYGLNSGGGSSTITLQLSGTPGFTYAANVSEWSGLGGVDNAPTGIFDNSGSTPAKAPSTSATNATSAGDLFVGAVAATANETGSPSGGFSALSNGASHHVAFGDLIAADATSHQYSIGLATSATWAGIGTSFVPATISAVQNSSTDATSGTTETVTLAAPVTAGDGLVLLFGNQTDLVTISSVSGGGVTWTKADQENDTTIKGDVEIWYGLNSTGGSGSSTITLQLSGTPGFTYAANVSEWSGLGGVDNAPAGIFDNTGSTPAKAPTTSATKTGDLFVAAVAATANETGSPSGGFGALSNGASHHVAFGDLIPADANSHQYTIGLLSSATWAGIGASFLPASPHASTVDVTVTTPSGTSATGSADQFTYALVPGAPTGVSATALQASSTTVSWSAPTSNGGTPVTSYTVVTVQGGTTVTVSAPTTSATVTGLTDASFYQFVVYATNAIGTGPASAPSNSVGPGPPLGLQPGAESYRFVESHGGVDSFGNDLFYGSMGNTQLNAPISGIAVTGSSLGYWEVGQDGGVFAFGNAAFYGSLPTLTAPIVGIARTPDSGGYWLVGSDGHIYAYGDANYDGAPNCTNPPSCTNSFPIRSPVIAIVPTNSGSGYWEADTNGDVYGFGNATYEGSSGCVNPNLTCGGSNSFTVTDITAMAQDGANNGYWLVGADGGVFAFGNAGFFGSTGAIAVGNIIGAATTGDGNGYWLLGTDGALYGFGDAGYLGSMAIPGVSLGGPNDVVGMTSP